MVLSFKSDSCGMMRVNCHSGTVPADRTTRVRGLFFFFTFLFFFFSFQLGARDDTGELFEVIVMNDAPSQRADARK